MSSIDLLNCSQFLTTSYQKTLTRQLPWDSYIRASIISPEDSQSILSLADKSLKRNKIERSNEESIEIAGLLAKLLAELKRNEPITFTLVLLAQLIQNDETLITTFYTLTSPSSLPTIFPALSKHIPSSDPLISLLSLVLLTIFASDSPSPLPPSFLSPVLAQIAGMLNQPTDPSPTSSSPPSIALPSLSLLLSKPNVRRIVWDQDISASVPPESKVIPALVSLLSKPSARPVASASGTATPTGRRNEEGDPQVVYGVVMCFWLLSFDEEVAGGIEEKYSIITITSSLLHLHPNRPKILRVITSTYRNLLHLSPSKNLRPMLLWKLKMIEWLDEVSKRLERTEDLEWKEDTEWVRERLKEGEGGITTWDSYLTELNSKQLSWSPLHANEDFWKDNVAKFNEKDYENLKKLVDVLMSSKDPEVLAVAASDVGMYLKYYETGRDKAKELGAKAKCMELMSYEDSDVRYRALITVQKFISYQ